MTTIRDEQKGIKLGSRVSRLTVIGKPFSVRLGGDRVAGSPLVIQWLAVVECECGRIAAMNVAYLANKKTPNKSCGCFNKTRAKQGVIRRSHSAAGVGRRTKLYRVWCTMKERCSNPHNHKFPRYGARGIRVCDEWSEDFAAFREWSMKAGYREGLTIDRINNDGNYEPGNCQWITKSENSKKVAVDRRLRLAL